MLPATLKVGDKWGLITMGLGLMLAASNMFTMRENQRLRNLIELQRGPLYPQVGTNLPELRGQDIYGRPITISFASSSADTLMLVFNPACVHCQRNWPNWSRLVSESAGAQVVFVNVGGALSAAFVQEHKLASATVVARPDRDSLVKYSLLETPITLRISPAGQVLGSWGGELGSSGVSEVKAALTARPR